MTSLRYDAVKSYMERVFIVHGWTTTNEGDWIPWLRGELEDNGFEVYAPLMPDTNHPIVEDWIEKLRDVVGVVRTDDKFVGHSLGCQAILRFLETQNDGTKIDKLVLVAGAQVLSKEAIPLPEDEQIFGPWRDTPINFPKIRGMCNKTVAIFSDNDPWVILQENAPIYEKELGARIIIAKGMGHFMKDLGGVVELPVVRDILMSTK